MDLADAKCSITTRWITFDCFGTLVDWNSGFSTILAAFAGHRSAQLLSAYHEFERQVETERPHKLYKEVLVTALLLAAEKTGVSLSREQAWNVPHCWSSLPIFDDVEPILGTLRAAGYKLAVLTNCDNDLFEQTQRCFKQPFDLVVTAEQVRTYKPAPGHFRHFETQTAIDRTNWVHVACSWFHDIAPAREAGVKSIWLDRECTGHDSAAASLRITLMNDLPGAIASLLTGQ